MRPRDGLHSYPAAQSTAELTQTKRSFLQPDSHQNSIIPITPVAEDSSANEPGTNDSTPEVELPSQPVHSQDRDDEAVTIEAARDRSSTGPHPDASLETEPQGSLDTEDRPELEPDAALEAARPSNAKSSSASFYEEAKAVAQLSTIVMTIVVIILWLLLR